MLRVIVAIALLLTGACGGDDPLAKLEQFAERMCACNDSACADKINDELIAWMRDHADQDDPGDADKKRAEAAMVKMVECAKKASLGAGAEKKPSSPDKAETPEADKPPEP